MDGFKIGRLFGIDLRVHASWFIIAALVTWTLYASALPMDFPRMADPERLAMAAGIMLLFFASLLAHEMAHSLVALRRGIPVRRITFFLFGGMAQTERDSRTPGEEFLIAIAGPAASFALAAAFFGSWLAGARWGWPAPLLGAAGYMAALNLVLGTFNLIPGFPMDGGRVLRAAIWKATGNVTLATRWASRVGVWLSMALVAYGVWEVFRGQVMSGMWMVLIALFVRNAAKTSYRQHVLGRLDDFMRGGGSGGLQFRVGRPDRPDIAPAGLTGRDVTALGHNEA